MSPFAARIAAVTFALLFAEQHGILFCEARIAWGLN